MYKYITIGEILKSTQSKGKLMALVYDNFTEDLFNVEAIFLEIDGLQVPFFIEEIELKDNLFYIKFEEFNNPEDVKKFNGAKLSLRHRDIDLENKNIKDLVLNSHLSGYTIYDNNTGTEMIIEKIEQFPHQLMARVSTKNTLQGNSPFLIPMIEEFIKEINDNNKTIQMTLPDGLIEE